MAVIFLPLFELSLIYLGLTLRLSTPPRPDAAADPDDPVDLVAAATFPATEALLLRAFTPCVCTSAFFMIKVPPVYFW